jgi:hypothetical protein
MDTVPVSSTATATTQTTAAAKTTNTSTITNTITTTASVIEPSGGSAQSKASKRVLTSAEKGAWSWALLHTTSLAYPEVPTTEDAVAAVDLIEAFGMLYPCTKCLPHLQRELQDHPVSPHVIHRRGFFQWTVDLHNRVNVRLQKPQATLASAALRWGGDFEAGSLNRVPVDQKDHEACWRAALLFALSFPEAPTRPQQDAAVSFLRALHRLFPRAQVRAVDAAVLDTPLAQLVSSGMHRGAFVSALAALAAAHDAATTDGFSSNFLTLLDDLGSAECSDCSMEPRSGEGSGTPQEEDTLASGSSSSSSSSSGSSGSGSMALSEPVAAQGSERVAAQGSEQRRQAKSMGPPPPPLLWNVAVIFLVVLGALLLLGLLVNVTFPRSPKKPPPAPDTPPALRQP